jgi:hypothetical protein
MNYAALVQAIQDFSETDEPSFVTNIPLFVKQCEQRVYNSVQIPVLRKNVTGALTTSNKYLSCPDDFLSVYSIAVINSTGEYSYLLDKDVSYMREAYPNPTLTGLPRYYAIFGPQSANLSELSIILAPAPSANYSVELHYYYYPESITTATLGTTWLSDNYDPVLLYGSLREAIIYMKGEQDMVGYYEQKFQEALGQLKRLCDGLERGDAYREGQTKIPLKAL